MIDCFSGCIQQIGIIFSSLASSTEDIRLVFYRMEIAIVGDQFQLSYELGTLQIMQLFQFNCNTSPGNTFHFERQAVLFSNVVVFVKWFFNHSNCFSVCKDTVFFGKFQEKGEKYVF